ncbi:AraC family transcriptional regulator [Halobacillus sp. Marseille-Q1614]|uniref:AraC family transcriptional regulator n=1 Tax=Halobacillus sp. Marseille-Q1614 TaxID=2709134 RepID=UPI0020C41571|nr:AraC family transcriptional regulator [Halobacillus sp. Marseille-Q1614]
MMIADRDQQEAAGLNWLVDKYSFPISESKQISELAEVMAVLENERPDVLCLELDMVPEEKWDMMKTFIDRYVHEVIAVTAESTFERAMQAMSIKALDLWVKPLSPNSVKRSLQQAFHKLSNSVRALEDNYSVPSIRYESLFMEDHLSFQYPVYLVKTESMDDLAVLRSFIDQFDFYYQPLVFSTSDRIALVFQEYISEPLKQAQNFMQEWDREVGKPLVIAVHSEPGEESLHQIYMKLRQVMETTFFTGYQQVLTKVYEWQDMDPFLTMTEQRTWVYMLDEGRRDQIKSWLYEQFFNINPPYPDPGLLRTRLTSILAQVRRFMIRKGMIDEENEKMYKRVFDSILYSPVLYRIVQDLILFINDLLGVIAETPGPGKKDAIEEAIVYMEEHYRKAELTLQDVADHVQRNPSYLSYLFMKRYGRSFREVLSTIRIQEAKELLVASDDTIQLIADQTGYSSPNYFSRVFKQATGKTPNQYRRRH